MYIIFKPSLFTIVDFGGGGIHNTQLVQEKLLSINILLVHLFLDNMYFARARSNFKLLLKTLNLFTLLRSNRPKLHGVLAVLSAIGLKFCGLLAMPRVYPKLCPKITHVILINLIPFTAASVPVGWLVLRILEAFVYTEKESNI